MVNNFPFFQPVAPPLDDSLSHHVLFIFHPNDLGWVKEVMSRLQIPTLGFKCWHSQQKDTEKSSGKIHENTNGFRTKLKKESSIKRFLKTIIVISESFVIEFLNGNSENVEMNCLRNQDAALDNYIVVLLDNSDVPDSFRYVTCVDARIPRWWTRLVGQLCTDGKENILLLLTRKKWFHK